MDDGLHLTLAAWSDFYLITGSAAAALTGLQFVVQTLIASDSVRPNSGGDPEGTIDAFGTPTVVHFSLVLLLSAVLCAPWPTYEGLRETLGVMGSGSLVYAFIVMRRALRQKNYVPVLEDWLWHIVLPAVAYTAVITAAMLFHRGADGSLFVLAAATLLLLCAGIHNAWDTVAYVTAHAMRHKRGEYPAPPAPRKQTGARNKSRR